MSRGGSTPAIWLLVALTASVCGASEPCVVSGDEGASIEQLLVGGQLERAVEVAEELHARCPGDPNARLLLARTQVRSGFGLSARKTLEEAESSGSPDCQARAWLVWLDIEQLRWDEARARLGDEGCPVTDEERGRWGLLGALLAKQEGDVEGLRSSLGRVGERRPLLPEDEELDAALRWRHVEGYRLPFEATFEMGLGATSNAFAASPVDAALREPVASALARPAATIRLRAPEMAVTPVVEARAWGLGMAAAAARSRSNGVVSIDAGARLGRGSVRPLLTFQHEEVLLNQEDRKRYAAANRLQAEVAVGRRLTLLGGWGRRTFFTDDWRTRKEGDAAAILGVSAFGRPLLLAGAFRFFDANRAVHDQIGVTFTAATDVPVGHGLTARLIGALAYDDFPRSGGFDGLLAFGTSDRRRDVLTRFSAGLWRRLSDRVAAGATYDFARRWSTADAADIRYYPYVDHRFTLSLRLELGGNPWRRPTRTKPGHVRMPYAELERPPVLLDDLVRGLLRQQDELSHDCGCVVP